MRISEVLNMADIRTDTAFAVRMAGAADGEGFPQERAWETAPPTFFNADWQGKNADRQQETHVRLLWTQDFFFLRFAAWSGTIAFFPDSDPPGRRHRLGGRAVCEFFLQPPCSDVHSYKEI